MAECHLYQTDMQPGRVLAESQNCWQWMQPQPWVECPDLEAGEVPCCDINVGDLMAAYVDEAASCSYVVSGCCFPFNTDVATTQAAFVEAFAGVSLSVMCCDKCYDTHPCGVRIDKNQCGCEHRTRFDIVDETGAEAIIQYTQQTLFTIAPNATGDGLDCTKLMVTDDPALALMKPVNDTCGVASSSVVVTFL